MFASMFGPMFRPMFDSSSDAPDQSRWAYNFDGVNDYGTFQARAINVSNDIDIEWQQRGASQVGSVSIVTQCDSANPDARELELKWLSGKLWFEVGGALLLYGVDNILSSDGLWRVTLIGSVVTVYFNGAQVFTVNRNRGISREASAPTRLGVLNDGGTLTNFFKGVLFDLRINSRTWPIIDNTQAVQASDPAGNNLTLVNSNPENWIRQY